MQKACVIDLKWLVGRAATLLAACALCLPLKAGEKLNITGAKTRINPASAEASTVKIKAITTLASPSPFDGTMPQTSPRWRARDSRLQKKLQNERDERDNWALLAPGELQDAEGEEYDFGVREYSLDDLEKKKETRDYTFYGLDKAKDQDSGNQVRSGLRPQKNGVSGTNTRLDDRSRASNSRSEELGKTGRNDKPNPFRLTRSEGGPPSLGAHLASELDLKDMLSTPETRQAFRDSQPSLGSLLGAPSQGPNQREQEQRMDNFRQLLNTGLSGSGNLSDPLSYSADKTRQPLNPGVPSSAQQRDIAQPQGSLRMIPNSSSLNLPSPSGSVGIPGYPNAFQPEIPNTERAPSQIFRPVPQAPQRRF